MGKAGLGWDGVRMGLRVGLGVGLRVGLGVGVECQSDRSPYLKTRAEGESPCSRVKRLPWGSYRRGPALVDPSLGGPSYLSASHCSNLDITASTQFN